MSDLISGIVQKQLGGNAGGMEKQAQQSQQGGRSFENVLQQNASGGSQNAANGIQQVGQVNDPKLEAMRADLTNRYQSLPQGAPKTSVIFPEYLDTKTRMGAFNDILNKAIDSTGGGMSTQATDIKGRFSQVEGEWSKLDNIMRSNKDMSQGELLGLQARLYQVSQHIDVLSKVVDQMSSGVKSILNTNV